MEDISDNKPLETAQRIIESTNTNLFLTGKAGTGKTTFLHRLREKSPKRMVVLAPTGIAAINAKGVTIHSFFQLPFAPYIPGANYSEKNDFKVRKDKVKLIRSLDLLVIDEISMVRADLLDAVDAALKRYRRNALPFGGVQLLLIGDLQQLAPVVKEEEWSIMRRYYETPYFFSSIALRKTNYMTVELQHVYRQSDPYFLSLLNSVREGKADEKTLEALNSRYIPNFSPESTDGYIRLVTHNEQARRINDEKLALLSESSFTFQAEIKGKFPDYAYPTEDTLELKKGAQVMFVKNDTGKKYYNGMIGEITSISKKGFTVVPKDRPGEQVEVTRDIWENTRYGLDPKTQEITEIVEGTFCQFPVKLAWAITIHKSQGLTFDHVIINAASSFAHGQTYVALSRCKTLEGIVLSKKIPPSAIITDCQVDLFNHSVMNNVPNEDDLGKMSVSYALHLLSELFSFDNERMVLSSLKRQADEYLYKVYPDLTAAYDDCFTSFIAEMVDVAARFHKQYEQLLMTASGEVENEKLQERIKKGAFYFNERLEALRAFILRYKPEIDNKEVKRRYVEASNELQRETEVHSKLLKRVWEKGFNISDYLDSRARLTIQVEENAKKSEKAKETKLETYAVPTAIEDPHLYYRLMAWRTRKAAEEERTPSNILTVKSIIALSTYKPTTTDELKRIPKVGEKTILRYGKEILELIEEYSKSIEDENSERPVRPISTDTRRQSLDLFRAGKSPKEIADMRSITEGTVLGHLASFFDTGEVTVEELVESETINRAKSYFNAHPYIKGEQSFSDIKDQIGTISFNELRVVMKSLGYE